MNMYLKINEENAKKLHEFLANSDFEITEKICKEFKVVNPNEVREYDNAIEKVYTDLDYMLRSNKREIIMENVYKDYKVGDRIEVVNPLEGNKKYFEKGFKGTVLEVYKSFVTVKFDKITDTIKDLEIEDKDVWDCSFNEIQPRQYNTKTLLQLISEIRKGEYWEAKYDFTFYVYCDENGRLEINIEKDMPLDAPFVYVRKAVDFMEAFAEMENGKTIRSDYSGYSYKIENTICKYFSETFDKWAISQGFNANEIKNKWYVVEDNNEQRYDN